MISREELYRSPEYWVERTQNDIFRAAHAYMEQKGYNQSALAKDLGVTKGYVSQILNGNFNFSLKKLIELSLKLGIAPKLDLTEPLNEYAENQEKRLGYMQAHGFVSIKVNAPLKPYHLRIEEGENSDIPLLSA